MKLTRMVGKTVAACAFAGSVLLVSNVEASFVPLGASNYVQNFNSPALPKNGQSKELPSGWSFLETGSGNDKIKADDGRSAAGGIYSYGDKHSDDRALGILLGQNGSSGMFGASFENAGQGSITRLDISFTGEEWRLGQAGRQAELQFQYSLNANSLTSGQWFNVPQLDFFTPNVNGVGAHDGNLPQNQQHLSGSISFLDIPSGGNFWIRWVEAAPPGGGPGDGLAIDNFSISAVPEMSTYLGGIVASALLAFALLPRLRPYSRRG